MPKYLDGVQVVENTASVPRLIATITPAQLIASGTAYRLYEKTLNRNATQRTIIFVNGFNQPLTSVGVLLYDSTVNTGSKGGLSSNIQSNLSVNTQCVATSEQNPILSSHVDSIQIMPAVGATLPVSGDLKVYIVELI